MDSFSSFKKFKASDCLKALLYLLHCNTTYSVLGKPKVGTPMTPMTPDTPDSDEDDDIDTFNEEFTLHKRHYYMTKMEYENVDK